ncbi:MAG TPA: sialidase family protein, partial [Chitinophagaceae bacterium]|nr:sialidase family protein [Chitinophagaceae bacterium]
MKKLLPFLPLALPVILSLSSLVINTHITPPYYAENENKEEREDGILLSQQQEFEMTKDVILGHIPKYRLINAYENLIRQRQMRTNSTSSVEALTWMERGSYSDVVGPDNGNGRPGNGVTSGRIRAIWVDLADATNKTVWIGGIDGGIWKTTDITASPAAWTLVNDFFGNMAIASICQDPSNTNTMYFGTGEKTFNSDAVFGGGVWKSADHGATWSLLPNTTNFYNVSKIVCDPAGNVYVGTIGSGSGLQRSTDGGATWTNITPTTAGGGTRIADIELSSTGRMHVSKGYLSSAANQTGYFYSDNPATVTSATWTSPVTPFTSTQYNVDLAVAGNTLYALPSNSNYETPQIYKSIDGGASWATTIASPPAASGNNDLSSGQGWYSIAIAVDPSNANNVIVGGLNCYKTTNGGNTWSQLSVWVSGISGTVSNYIHADQHIITWNVNQVLVGSDGGIFYSAN